MREDRTPRGARRIADRRQAFRARLAKSKQGVSPVVATLILILVAVAAAAALYLWLVAWQGNATKGIGNPNSQYTVSIGGSTTVYPLDQQAIKYFEENNSDVTISDNPGGSGAGLLAVCSGAVDIAAMSRPMKSTELATCPTAVQTVIGYDSVSVTLASNNNGGLTSSASYGEGELLAIYWQNGGQPTAGAGFPTVIGPAAGGASDLVGAPAVPSATGIPADWGLVQTGANVAPYTWSEVPKVACYDPAVSATYSADLTSAGQWTGVPSTEGTVYAGPCAADWVLSGYPTSSGTINVYGRGDNSGTEEAFDNNVLGISCGTDNQLASCGFPVTSVLKTSGSVNVATGNPALLNAIAADPNALGFNSWGLTYAPVSSGGGGIGSASAKVVDVAVQGNSQSAPVAPSLGTIKTGIAAGYSVQVSGGYIGWRPLQYVTLGTPSGESQRFIQFVTQPGNDQTLCAQNFFISVYS